MTDALSEWDPLAELAAVEAAETAERGEVRWADGWCDPRTVADDDRRRRGWGIAERDAAAFTETAPSAELGQALATVADALGDEEECPLALLLAHAVSGRSADEVLATVVPCGQRLLDQWRSPSPVVDDPGSVGEAARVAVALRWAEAAVSAFGLDPRQLEEMAVAAEATATGFSIDVDSALGRSVTALPAVTVLCRITQLCVVISVAVSACLGDHDPSVRGGDAIRWALGLAENPYPDVAFEIGIE